MNAIATTGGVRALPASETFRQNIRRLRATRELSQSAFARAAGISIRELRNIEGGYSSPRLETAELMARALEVELWTLVRDSGLPPQPWPTPVPAPDATTRDAILDFMRAHDGCAAFVDIAAILPNTEGALRQALYMLKRAKVIRSTGIGTYALEVPHG